MQTSIASKGIDVSAALSERITDRVAVAVEKYFNRPGEAHVSIQRDGPGFRVDCTLHLPSGALLRTSGDGGDAYGAAEMALVRLEKRLRRYKRKLTDRRGPETHAAALKILQSQLPVFDDADDEKEPETEAAEADPIVIAETTAELPVLTVGMAVREMDLTDTPVLMFRNAAHDGLNVVYRRPDGHIGWLDPSRPTGSA